MTQTFRTAILGASGYTGAELVRLIATHPHLKISALTANSKAGQAMASVFPQCVGMDLPDLIRIEDLDPASIDIAFCALPHATTQEVVSALPRDLKIVDLSADFRLRDPAAYEAWYGRPHGALDLQDEAVYGLTEFYREQIAGARLVAGTGCNAATVMYGVLPLLAAGVVEPDEISVALMAGVSGAGRSAKEGLLHTEVSEGVHPYSITGHRHVAEFEQEFSKVAGRPVTCSFMPHLMPMNRGILATIHVRGEASAIHAALAERYSAEPFVHVLPLGEAPSTRHVRGSNLCRIGVVPDRVPGRVYVFSTLDNLMKGASGQAVQNANLMLGLEESAGLTLAPVFP
ncbi:MAG: N-acetyl-gamma-glutamyl-phosphate reductase [Neomegalonema sp.]|nr:N-acetyl-gamma-glutamyl-phosphate reductase [Neomegalonema sp.]